MNKTIFSVFGDALLLLVRRPLYLVLGTVAFFPENILIFVSSEDIKNFSDFLLSLPIISPFLSHGNFEPVVFSLLFCASMALWLIQITSFSFICLDILSREKNRAEKKYNFRRAIFTAPRIALVRIAGSLFFSLLLYLLVLPVQSLVTIGAVSSAWFLGLFALLVFLGFGASFFSVFLFSHFYILFARLSVRASLHTAANLFLKQKNVSLLFILWTGASFFLLLAFSLLLPGLKIHGLTLVSLSSETPLAFAIAGYLFKGALSILLSTLFPVSATLFFLRIARKKKKKKARLERLEKILSPLIKKKSEAPQEMK